MASLRSCHESLVKRVYEIRRFKILVRLIEYVGGDDISGEGCECAEEVDWVSIGGILVELATEKVELLPYHWLEIGYALFGEQR